MANKGMEALASLREKSKDNAEFFDRERELNKLLNFIERGINRIVVVAGPINCGKSAILKRLETLWDKNPVLQAHFPLFRIDMRDTDYTTPARAASAIITKLRTWSSWFKDVGAAPGLGLPDLSALLANIPEDGLASAMSAFQRLAYANANVRPVFIIDEADRLKDWDDKNLRVILGCFIRMSKQDERATVILSSSDDFFRDWLRKYVNSAQWTLVGVGFFKEEDARQFFLKQLPPGLELSDGRWKMVYDVCGGSPLELKNCAFDMCCEDTALEDVLQGMIDANLSVVEEGRAGSLEDQGWEGAKFKQIVRMIVDAGGAVGVPQVHSEVFSSDDNDCWKQLGALCKANIIHVRYAPRVVAYDDLDKGGSSAAKFVMARSPSHLKAMALRSEA